MAATLWRAVLACEGMTALLITAAFASLARVSAPALVSGPALALVALAALVLTHFLLVAVLKGISRALARASEEGFSFVFAAQSLVLETLHFGLALLAMAAERPQRAAERVSEAAPGRSRPLLLVHGLACNRGIWRWLLRRLRTSGFGYVYSPNLEPLQADIDRLAVALEREVLRVHDTCGGARVTIIAHSMGGLVARAVLRTLGPEVIRQVITLSTPHHGASIARALRWPCARQMWPGSPWLDALNAAQEGRWRVPFTSLYTRDDSLVSPARSSALAGARSIELRGLGHFGLIVAPRGLDEVMRALGEPA